MSIEPHGTLGPGLWLDIRVLALKELGTVRQTMAYTGQMCLIHKDTDDTDEWGGWGKARTAGAREETQNSIHPEMCGLKLISVLSGEQFSKNILSRGFSKLAFITSIKECICQLQLSPLFIKVDPKKFCLEYSMRSIVQHGELSSISCNSL